MAYIVATIGMSGPAAREGDVRLRHPGPSRQALILPATAAAVTLVILAPLLWPGYALRFDLVFVPHQPLTWDLLAPADGLPRAVPEDLVVGLLSLIAPGWLLERVALGGAIFLAALGAGRLVPTASTSTRVIAALMYAWTPYLAERLLIGQWGLLLAYAVLPWLVRAAIGVRRGTPGAGGRLLLAAGLSAITPTGGLVALVTAVVLLVGLPLRRLVPLAGGIAILNTPWLVAALASSADGRSDPAGVAAFAVRAENWSGPLGALLGTGGVWNAQAVPASRSATLIPLVTLVFLALAAAGYPVLRAAWPGTVAGRLAGLSVGGLIVAALGAVGPTATGLAWLVAHGPGTGLLRDGPKYAMPYALLLALTVAAGAERLAVRLGRERGPLVLATVMVLTLLSLPDLAFGGLGAIRPVAYPSDWARITAIVAEDPGEVVALPLAAYRRYPWNPGRTVIDVAPRWLPAPVITDDTLVVGSTALAGESGRAAVIRDLVEHGRSVAGSGARWVLVQRDAGPPPPATALAGLERTFAGTDLSLYRDPGPGPVRVGSARYLMLLPYGAAFGVLLLAGWSLRRRATAW